MKILKGPDRDLLLMTFAKRWYIAFRLDCGEIKNFILNEVTFEDGSGCKFLFKTSDGVVGFYDTEKQKGFIKDK